MDFISVKVLQLWISRDGHIVAVAAVVMAVERGPRGESLVVPIPFLTQIFIFVPHFSTMRTQLDSLHYFEMLCVCITEMD